MALGVTCFYCGTKKEIEAGSVVKLSCDQCSSPRIILDRPAVFKCALCGETFRLPGKRQAFAFHEKENCRGRTLILLHY